MVAPLVIKIGGHDIAEDAFLTVLASTIRGLGQPTIIVHGGGEEISAMQQRLKIMPRMVYGLRATDDASLAVVEMVLCGTVNTRLVRYLLAGGVEALGVSGVDRGLIRARPLVVDGIEMGRTGEVADVRDVRDDVLREWLVMGVTPVIAPVCLGDDGTYNVNADHVAGAVAAAMNASRVIFVSNVPGVMVDGAVQPTLSAEDAEARIADGTIHGGMIPKVRTALHALSMGVSCAVITNLAGLQADRGTTVTAHTRTGV